MYLNMLSSILGIMKCIWFHNPDSGRQDIPDAVLEFPAWTSENVEKMLKILGKEGE